MAVHILAFGTTLLTPEERVENLKTTIRRLESDVESTEGLIETLEDQLETAEQDVGLHRAATLIVEAARAIVDAPTKEAVKGLAGTLFDRLSDIVNDGHLDQD